MPDNPTQSRDIPLGGRLITAVDGVTIGENFQTLQNMRYTATHIRAIAGMSKINTTALSGAATGATHYVKTFPTAESHIVAQVGGVVKQNTTAVPSAGDFSATNVHTDAAGYGNGRFANAPGGYLAYCNGKETLVWGGDESPLSGFIYSDSGASFSKDFTEKMQNNSTTGAAVLSEAGAPYLYIGSQLPLNGFKLYINSANANSVTMTVKYWTGSAWAAVSNLSDGTAVAGKTLAQTGSVTFDDTQSVAKILAKESKFVYWYQVYASGAVTNTTSIYFASVSFVMQTIKDIWDGIYRQPFSWLGSTGLVDNTLNVAEEDYSSANTGTYSNLSGMAPGTLIYAGFNKPMAGMLFVIPDGNSNASVITIKYWNGTSFAAVTNQVDNTSDSGKTLYKSGTITWTQPTDEFTSTIARGFPLYTYEISVSAALDATVHIDQVGGIPAQETIPAYDFPMIGQDRLWLCARADRDRNSARCTARDTFSVLNGTDTSEIFFGDDTKLTAACSLYSQFGSNLYDIMVFCKERETWIVTGSGPQDWVKLPASRTVGCVAPRSLVTAHVSGKTTGGVNYHVAFWQAADGMYMFDGRVPTRISDDISSFFEPTSSDKVNTAKKQDSVCFFDETYQELHWLFASNDSTTLNREFVYDIKKPGWYEIVRTAKLQYGIPVKDTTGNNYTYGFLTTGYMERLENGTTFDGSDMVFTFRIGDVIFGETSEIQTQILQVGLTTIAKSITTNTISGTYYVDTVQPSVGGTFTISPIHATQRVLFKTRSMARNKGTSHSFKMSMTTDNETIGFEPLALNILYHVVRYNKNG